MINIRNFIFYKRHFSHALVTATTSTAQQPENKNKNNVNEKRERHTSNDNLIANNLKQHCLQNVNTNETSKCC